MTHSHASPSAQPRLDIPRPQRRAILTLNGPATDPTPEPAADTPHASSAHPARRKRRSSEQQAKLTALLAAIDVGDGKTVGFRRAGLVYYLALQSHLSSFARLLATMMTTRIHVELNKAGDDYRMRVYPFAPAPIAEKMGIAVEQLFDALAELVEDEVLRFEVRKKDGRIIATFRGRFIRRALKPDGIRGAAPSATEGV